MTQIRFIGWFANLVGIGRKAISVAASDIPDRFSKGLTFQMYNQGNAYPAGAIVVVTVTSLSIGATQYSVAAGIYGARTSVPNGQSALNIPRWPEPPGHCWDLLAFAPTPLNDCAGAVYFNGYIPE